MVWKQQKTTNFFYDCPTLFSPPVSLPNYHLHIYHVPAAHKVDPCVPATSTLPSRLQVQDTAFEFIECKTHQDIFWSFPNKGQTSCAVDVEE